MPQDAAIPFLLGVNYPWLNYGQDFGEGPWGHCGISVPENRLRVAQDFAEIQDSGATTVRWFLFGDGRAGFLTEKGIPTKPDAFLFKDVGVVLSLAESIRPETLLFTDGFFVAAGSRRKTRRPCK